MLICPHCSTPKQLERPCQRCGFAGLAHNVATFMVLPPQPLVDDARLHAAQVAEAMMALSFSSQEIIH